MAVAFNAIPSNLIVPFWYAEVNSGGSPYQGPVSYTHLTLPTTPYV